MTLISIVIPAYNHARFISQAIECALAQTYPEVEIVVVDDGSTDATGSVLAAYQGRITSVRQDNQGPSAARNTGLRTTHGEYVLFLDADDLIPPHKLKRQSLPFQQRADLGVVYSSWQFVDETGTRCLAQTQPHPSSDVLKALLLRELFLPTGAALVRRACFERVGAFDEDLRAAEDTDLWVRIAAGGYSFLALDDCLFSYRVLDGSVSHNLTHQVQNELARLDKWFARTDLLAETQALRPEAYAAIYFEFGAKHYRSGQVSQAQGFVRQALASSPKLANDREWQLNWLAGYILDAGIEQPESLLDYIFDHLPPEATTLQGLRRRAHGRYHAALVFAAHRNRQLSSARPHVLPAITYDPVILRNRGFVRIALAALLA